MMLKRLLRPVLALVLILGLVLLSCSPACAAGRISSDEAMLSALAEMREKGAAEFRLSLTKKYWSALSKNKLEGFCEIILRAGMTNYKMQYSSSGDLKLSKVQWTEPHVAECATQDGFRQAVQELLSQSVPCCQIIVRDKTLFDRLCESSWTYSYCAMCGAEDLSVQYSLQAPYIIYLNDIRYFSVPWRRVGSEVEWTETVQAYADRNTETFFLVPEPAFAEALRTDRVMTARLETAVPTYEYVYTYSQETLIKVKASARYPGARIASAVASGNASGLSGREMETLAAAALMVEQCRRSDPLETAQAIHDALCARIVYTDDDSTDEDDSAVGALLNGQANCDGYADAFYLTGTLAGLEVKYQHGNIREKDADDRYRDVTHMWNLLNIDGTWRMVDVTWDDREDRTVYIWFNIGADRARRTHVWDEETSVPLLAETVLSERPENEYLVRDEAGARNAAADTLEKGYSFFTLVLSDGCEISMEEALDILSRVLNRSFTYSRNEYMRTLTVLYQETTGSHPRTGQKAFGIPAGKAGFGSDW